MAMFPKRPNAAPEPAPTGYSVIDAQMSVEGDVDTEGTLRIDGRLRGDVRRADVLVLAAGASIVGSVSAREVIIGGSITGNVTATQRVELLPPQLRHRDQSFGRYYQRSRQSWPSHRNPRTPLISRHYFPPPDCGRG